MGKTLEAFGLQAAQGILGAGMGMILGEQADKRQIAQQRKLQDMQIQGQMEMMDYGQEKQLQMWEKTNYKAQMEQLRKAGLNPGLLYGMGGGGGATAQAAGGNVSGGNAPVGGGEPTHMAQVGMGLNLQLLEAQKENIQANTNKTNVEAEKIGGVDTGLTRTQIMSLTAGVDEIRARTALAEMEAKLKGWEEQLKGRTIEDSVRAIGWMAEQADQRLAQMRFETNISEETWNDKVKMVKAELMGIWLRNALTRQATTESKSRVAVNEQQIKNMANDIVQRGMEWETRQQGANTQQRAQSYDEFINDMQKSTGIPIDILREAVDGVLRTRSKRTVREGWSQERGDYYETHKEY